MMMSSVKKVAILATAIGQRNRGIGQYEKAVLPHLVEELLRLGSAVTLIVSKDAPDMPFRAGVRVRRLPVQRDSTWLRLLAEQVVVPWVSRGADAFVSLESVFPFLPVAARSRIVVVHDVHVLRHRRDPSGYPEDYGRPYKLWANLATQRAVSAATKIVTVSQFTKDEIRDMFGTPAEKIIPIHNGLDQTRFRFSRGGTDPRSTFSLPSAYYLYIGPFSRKKNLRVIIEALALAKPGDAWHLPVVVAGDTRRSALYGSTLDLVRQRGLEKYFHFLGSVPDQEIPPLYANARAFIYPSYYEGFGLPPLEAMACGTPVIASNRSSLPEILGDAALYIDPDDPLTLIECLKKVQGSAIRRKMIALGLKRAGLFRWERTARRLAEAIES